MYTHVQHTNTRMEMHIAQNTPATTKVFGMKLLVFDTQTICRCVFWNKPKDIYRNVTDEMTQSTYFMH